MCLEMIVIHLLRGIFDFLILENSFMWKKLALELKAITKSEITTIKEHFIGKKRHDYPVGMQRHEQINKYIYEIYLFDLERNVDRFKRSFQSLFFMLLYCFIFSCAYYLICTMYRHQFECVGRRASLGGYISLLLVLYLVMVNLDYNFTSTLTNWYSEVFIDVFMNKKLVITWPLSMGYVTI
ncbi:hypothetical protein ACJX0J_006891, partial [Zea mays]